MTQEDRYSQVTHAEELKLARATLQQLDSMIYWARPDGSFVFVNQAFLKKLKYQPSAIDNLTVTDLFPHAMAARYRADWKDLMSGQALEGEMAIRNHSGASLPVRYRIVLIRINGHPFSCGTLRDISGDNAQEAQLHEQMRQNEQLRQELIEENLILKEEIDLDSHFENIITHSEDYKNVLRKVEQVADSDATVMIHGETGTGKGLLARAVHRLSDRSDRPMVKVNCAALPASLLESELFGHEKGAFTGAFERKKGRFERAHRGTIFLDEIAEIPVELQPKLLHVLQEGVFERVGGQESVSVDVRVIAATNRNLEEYVENGKFREDLYYRLNVFPIYNPPLRHRKEDIPYLVKYFVDKYSVGTGKRIDIIPESALNRLFRYEFPGNVRELENIVERAVILTTGKTLRLDASILQASKRKVRGPQQFLTMEAMQRRHIVEALKRTQWRVSGHTGAAKLLDMHPKTLFSRMRKLGIRREDYLDL